MISSIHEYVEERVTPVVEQSLSYGAKASTGIWLGGLVAVIVALIWPAMPQFAFWCIAFCGAPSGIALFRRW